MEPVSTSFPVMGTTAHLVLLVDPPRMATDLVRCARHRLEVLESLWSRFRADSDIDRINRAGGRPVVVDPRTLELVAHAVDAWYATAGAFDPTVGASVVAAGYHTSFDELRGGEAATTVAPPGPGGIEIHETTGAVVVPEGVTIDLGGIGKGAAADRVAAHLVRSGAAGALVNLGGDLRAVGTPPTEGWTVDLALPGAASGRTIRLRSGAVCTSSTLRRRWRTTDGERHHLIDPSTGDSSDGPTVTATVVAATAEAAEVLATSAIARRSTDGAAELLLDHDAAGLLVDRDGTVTEVGPIEAFR